MEGLCGIKQWKIGKGSYPLATLLKALDAIDAADNINDGLRDAYEHLDSNKTTEKEWKDWYHKTAYEEGKITSEKITAKDIVGGDAVTKDAERLANILNFKGYSKARGKVDKITTPEMLSRAKALKREIISNGPIGANRVLSELHIFEKGIDKQKIVNELKSRQKVAKANVVKNLATDITYTGTFLELFGVDIDIIADANQLAAYKEIQDRFGKRKRIADLTDIEELNEKALEILKSVDDFKGLHIKKRAKEATKDVEKAEKFNKEVLSFKNTTFALPIPEHYNRRLTDAFRDITEADVSQMSNADKAVILEGFESAKQGFYAHALNEAVSTLLRVKKGRVIFKAVLTSKGYTGKVGKFYNEILENVNDVFSLRPQKSHAGRKLGGTPKYLIDQTLGIQGTTIKDNLLASLSAGNQLQQDHFQTWNAKGEALTAAHKKHFKVDRRKRTRSHALITLYMYDREFQNNRGKHGLLSASQAIQAIKDNYRKSSDYGEHDVKMLEELENKYAVDGVWDLAKIEKDFVKVEQDIVDFNDESAGASMGMISTIATRNGELPPLYKKYTPHSVISGESGNDVSLDNYENYLLDGAPIKANVLFARKNIGKGMPRLYDPVGTIVRAQRFLGMEYYMAETIRDSHAIMNNMIKHAEKDASDLHYDIVRGIKEDVTDTIRRDVLRKTQIPSATDRVMSELFKQSYAAQLVSVPRMAAEATSNMAFAVLYRSKELSAGMSSDIVWDTNKGMEVLRSLGASSLQRLYSVGEYASPHAETTFFTANNFTKLKYMSPSAAKIATVSDFISNSKIWGGGKAAVTRIADWAITTPDRVIARPLFFGTLQTEFRNITKKDIDYDLLTAKTKAGETYRAENRDALEAAKNKADLVATQAGATNDVYMSTTKLQKDPGATGLENVGRAVGYYMMRFSLFEYASFQTAIKSLQGKGALSAEEGGRLLVATMARMALYAPIYATLVKLISNLLGLNEEDEEEIGFGKDLQFSFIGTLLTLGLMKNFNVFQREGISSIIESFNEEYLEGLRNGQEYDPWKHSLVFRLYSEKDLERKGLWGSAVKLTGPLRPIIADADRIYKYGTPADMLIFWLTYGGRLPFPKDFNRFNKQYQWIKHQEEKNKK